MLIRERYEIVAELGAGGEARVVKALDRQHGRFVALKLRHVYDDAVRDELLAEARVLLALPPHPALPLVREDFFEGDRYVVAMDWVDGTNLAALLADRGHPGLAPSSALAYLAQAAEALTHLHAQRVIHGDLKPANLILAKGGRITLVDFGVSSAPNAPGRRAGTPGYRAPELAAGAEPSRASDVYGLAATAFALLTGAPPAGLLPAWDGIPADQAAQLEAALRLGMATDPARRPKTAGELVERLRAGWTDALPTGVVTFCLSDIAGAAALWDAQPEAMAEALVRHDELIADAVEAHAGSFMSSLGDATLSVFDSAPAAVAAALDANRALAAQAWPPGIAITAGWGLHTGETDRNGTDFSGPAMSQAARLRAQADGGQILLSPVTADLARGHLPAGCSIVDLGEIRALKGPGLRTPAAECPYRGLLAFEPDDRAVFFGREQVVAEIVARLAPGRLLAVVGASGSGKSSVLRAGVVAAVRAGEVPGFRRATVITPGELAVADAADELVVVDQFEELFTRTEDRAPFIDALLALRSAVVIGVRADFYGRLSEHAGLARAVAARQVLLGAMSAAELERAVTEPARLAGLKLEPGLADLILRDVAAEPGALPLLSHALQATWERRERGTLTVAGYRASGGVATAIAHTADSVVDALPADQRALVRGVFLRMTELGEGIEDTRRRVPVAELVPERAAPGSVEALLATLADARLVTLDGDSAEVAHEALIREWPRLRRWLDEDRAGARVRRELAHAARLWEAGGREPSDLYRGARLATALELGSDLNALERAFLDAGAAEADRELRLKTRANRRLRALLGAAMVLLVVAVVAGILSFVQRGHARQAQNAAEAQSLSSDAERVGALALSEPTLERSLLLAATGVTLEDRAQTRGDLLAVLQANPAALRTLRVSSVPTRSFAASRDGRVLVSGDLAGVLRFTDLRTWKPAGAPIQLPHPVGVQTIKYSPDGKTLAVGTGEGEQTQLYSVDLARRSARRIGAWPGPVGPANFVNLSFAFSPDGRRLAVALGTWSDKTGVYGTATQRFFLLDPRSGRQVWRRQYPFHRGQMEAHVLFAPDGALITSATQSQTLVWDARSGRIVRRYPIGGRPALSPDGRRVALALNSYSVADPSAAVAILDLGSGRHWRLRGDLPDEWVMSLAFTPDGRRLVAPSFGGAHVWDLASGEIVDTYRGQEGLIGSDSDLVMDSRGVAIFTSGDGNLTAWDTSGTRAVGRTLPLPTAENPDCLTSFNCSATEPHSALMASGVGSGRIHLVDLRSLRVVATLPARDGSTDVSPAFLPGGRRLVTGGNAGTVSIWDLRSRTVVRRLRYAEPVLALAVSPDGSLLAVQRQRSLGEDTHVEVRDLSSGRVRYVRTLPFGGSGISFSADSRELVASGCCEGGAMVAAWDARSGALRFQHAVQQVMPVFAVSPTEPIAAAGTGDGHVLFWDTHTGRSLGQAKVTAADVAELAFSPDGQTLAVAPGTGAVALWDVHTRKRIGTSFPRVKGWVPGILFEPDGRLILHEPTTAIVWPTDRPTLQRTACRIAGRNLTREEWKDLLPNRPYRAACTGS